MSSCACKCEEKGCDSCCYCGRNFGEGFSESPKKIMKRYLVFGGSQYYPDGGWDDFKESFNNKEAAILHARECEGEWDYSWSQVIDTETGKELEY